MKKLLSTFAILFALSFALSACSDDKTVVVPTDAGTDSGDVDATLPGDDAGDDAAVASGACTNATDLAAIGPQGDEREDYGAGSDQSVTDVAKACGQANIATPDEVVGCIQQTVETLSDECAGCYKASVLCAINGGQEPNCIQPCLTGTEEECNACLCENGCVSAFETCSGRTSNTCDSL